MLVVVARQIVENVEAKGWNQKQAKTIPWPS